MPKVWIIWYAVLLHFAWAVLLVTGNTVLGTTPVHAFSFIGNNVAIAIVLILVAGSATAGLVSGKQPYHQALAATPQQFLLLISAGGAVDAVIRGQYADGIERPWVFILADQLPSILVAFVHTLALLDLAGIRLRWMR